MSTTQSAAINVHRLKTWTGFFNATVEGFKPFELRLDDRGFQLNDILILREYDPKRKAFLGPCFTVKVTYVLRLKAFLDIKGWRWAIARAVIPNLVVMGIRPLGGE